MTLRRITYDWHGSLIERDPRAGDVLYTARSVYRIVSARLVTRREITDPDRKRFALMVDKLAVTPAQAHTVLERGQVLFRMRWYPRGSRKRSAGNARQRAPSV